MRTLVIMRHSRHCGGCKHPGQQHGFLRGSLEVAEGFEVRGLGKPHRFRRVFHVPLHRCMYDRQPETRLIVPSSKFYYFHTRGGGRRRRARKPTYLEHLHGD